LAEVKKPRRMRLVKIINLVRFNGDFIFVIVCDVLMLSKWCITSRLYPLPPLHLVLLHYCGGKSPTAPCGRAAAWQRDSWCVAWGHESRGNAGKRQAPEHALRPERGFPCNEVR